ncbi:MAG: hypothetical protein GY835_11370 [bacterium]|nr:hypothetical protein [bacterium]
MKLLTEIALFISFLCMLALLAYVFYLKLCGRFSRERYAFVALGATISVAIMAVGAIFVAAPWHIIASLLPHVFNAPPVRLPESHWAEKVLVLGFAAFVIWILHRNFAIWTEPKSSRHVRMLRLHESTNYISEGLAEVLRILRRDAAAPLHSAVQSEHMGSALEPPSDTRAWRDDARELLELKCQQYSFDATEGWHDKAGCWIGCDLKTGSTVALRCSQERPDESQLGQYVEYVQALQTRSTNNIELFLALRDGRASTESVAGQQIRVVTEESLLNDLVDFTDYIMDIRKRVERDSLPDSELTISDIYSPSFLTNESGDDLGQTLEDYLLSWLAETGQRQVAVLGEYGQGKSTGALMFTHRLLTQLDRVPRKVPLFIELRGKSPATLQPVELLGAWASAYRIDPRALLKLLIKGRVFIIFEGFDEMAGVGDAEARFNHFRALWKFCFPAAKIVFTGRPNFFLDDTELRAALGIGSPLGTGPYCEHVHLKPFSIDEIKHSLRWAPASTKSDILSLAEQDEKFLDIVSRPSLLYIIGRLWDLPDFAEIKHTVDAAQVMGAFVQHCYRRQTEKHRGYPQFMVLTEAERKFFMDGLTAFMASNRMPNQLTRSQFEQAIADLYDVIPESLHGGAALPEVSQLNLKARLADREDALEIVKTDCRTYGLLVRDYSRPDALRFPHKSFFEYILGEFVAECLLNRNEEYNAAIQAATQFRVESVIDVPEALTFLGEIVSRGAPPDGQARDMVHHLFDAIVFPPRLQPLWIFRRLYLSSVTWLMIRSVRLFFLFILTLIPMLLMGRFFIFRDTAVSSNKVVMYWLLFMLMASVMLMLLMALRPATHTMHASRRGSRFRRIALWYCLVRSMGIVNATIEDAYGKLTVKAVAKVAALVSSKEFSERFMFPEEATKK